MADRLSDSEDEILRELFAADSIADDGFSDRILRRIRIRLWTQRLALPVAAVIGLLIAFKPMVQLASALPSIVALLPIGIEMPDILPATPTLLVGGLLLLAMLAMAQLADD